MRRPIAVCTVAAAFADASQVDRVETCLTGAHGMIVPAEVIEQAALAS